MWLSVVMFCGLLGIYCVGFRGYADWEDVHKLCVYVEILCWLPWICCVAFYLYIVLVSLGLLLNWEIDKSDRNFCKAFTCTLCPALMGLIYLY